MAIAALSPLASAVAVPVATYVARHVAPALPFAGILQGLTGGNAQKPEAEPEGAVLPELNELGRRLRWESRQAEAFAELRTFRQELDRELQAAGIDTSKEIVLQLQGEEVWERSGHPQRDVIERIISRPELADAFRRLARGFLQLDDEPAAEQLSDIRLAFREGEVEFEAG